MGLSLCFSRVLIPGADDRYMERIFSVPPWPKGSIVSVAKPLVTFNLVQNGGSLFPAPRAAILGRKMAAGRVLLHEIHLAFLPEVPPSHEAPPPKEAVDGENTCPSQCRPNESNDGIRARG